MLGIEDLEEGRRPGPDAPGDDAGSAGSGAVSNGGTASGGAGGAAGSGQPGGGSGGAAGAPLDGAPDAGPSAPITVAGRVIDFWRHPVPELLVSIGERQALTDDAGGFTIEGVVPPYDVSFVALTTQSDFVARYYGYVYQGLTRPDPTLQVHYGLPERNATVVLGLGDVTFGDDSRRLIFAFTSPDGYYAAPNISAGGPSLFPSWSGPASTAGSAHALLVLRASPAAGAPPLAYEAYQSTPLALADGADTSLSLELAPSAIPQVSLTGSIDAGQLGSPRHHVAARFADGSLLPLLAADADQREFSYLVPSLPGASLSVAGSAGPPGYVVAHVDGVAAAPDQDVALELPRPVTPSAPANGSVVGPGSTFAWSTLGQTTQLFVWHLESELLLEGIYVITSRSEIEFPVVPGYTLTLPPDNEFAFRWSVETHGDYTSVDAATGPEGFLDPFALELDVGSGPARGSRGYYTDSDARLVVIAPP